MDDYTEQIEQLIDLQTCNINLQQQILEKQDLIISLLGYVVAILCLFLAIIILIFVVGRLVNNTLLNNIR